MEDSNKIKKSNNVIKYEKYHVNKYIDLLLEIKIRILSLGCVRPRVIKDGERVHYLPSLKSKGALLIYQNGLLKFL